MWVGHPLARWRAAHRDGPPTDVSHHCPRLTLLPFQLLTKLGLEALGQIGEVLGIL